MLTRVDYELKTWNVNLQNMPCHSAILNNHVLQLYSVRRRALIGSQIDGFVLEKAHGLRTITMNRAESIRGFAKCNGSAENFELIPNSFRLDIWVMHTNQNSDFGPLMVLFGIVAFCPFCFRTRLMPNLKPVTLELAHKQDRQTVISKFMTN